MPPLGVLIGLCALFGLAVGSFLNVVIYRVPRHESIVSPPSACPTVRRPGGPPRQRAGPVLDTPPGPLPALPLPHLVAIPLCRARHCGVLRRGGRPPRLRLGRPGVPRPVRRAPRPLVDRRRTAGVAQGDRLPAARPSRRPSPHGRRLDGTVARPLGGGGLRGRLVHGVLRLELRRARVRSVSATSVWPRCSGWGSGGWA